MKAPYSMTGKMGVGRRNEKGLDPMSVKVRKSLFPADLTFGGKGLYGDKRPRDAAHDHRQSPSRTFSMDGHYR
jgi:hypothetical protein